MLFLLLAFEKKIKERFFYAHNQLWRCSSAGKQECTACLFLSVLVISLPLNCWEREGKMKEEYFKFLPKKKLRKENKNKNKKLNAKVRETRQYWECSNMKTKTTKAWRLGGSP